MVIRLEHRHVTLGLALALMLHMLAIMAWSWLPKDAIQTQEIQMLNIRLGRDGLNLIEQARSQYIAATTPKQVAMEEPAAPITATTTPEAQTMPDVNAVAQPTTEPEIPNTQPIQTAAQPLQPAAMAGSQIQPSPARHASKPKLRQTARANQPNTSNASKRLVRATPNHKLGTIEPAYGVASRGSALGNSNSADAEALNRYTQLISAWIQKHYHYPDNAKRLGLEGEATLRIRIDRRGNIRFFKFTDYTGHKVFDDAVWETMTRANPVPAPPRDYPGQHLLEFKIPFIFRLSQS